MDDKNQTDDSTTQAVDPTVVPADTATEEVVAEPTTEKETEEAPVVEEAPAASAASSEPAETDQQGRQLYTVKCSTCGKDTQVPFKPSDGRPVYCREDFMKMRSSQ